MAARTRYSQGFTLIELSIVLVISGLIVGGVRVGRSLIGAAEVRATITQIEKFNQAANTFFGKYGYLPGDIPDPTASSFGFAARGPYPGQGDGNGQIQTNYLNTSAGIAYRLQTVGETAMFWVDLSAVNLINGSFTAANSTTWPTFTLTGASVPSIGNYLPGAAIGGGNYFYVYSGGIVTSDDKNYFGLSAISQIANNTNPQSYPGLLVSQAYSIDRKVDDGLPQSGNVQAFYPNVGGMYWAAGGGNQGASSGGYYPTTSATVGSSTTCYDNNGVAGQNQQYSVGVNGGSNVNCALSFKMQAGD